MDSKTDKARRRTAQQQPQEAISKTKIQNEQKISSDNLVQPKLVKQTDNNGSNSKLIAKNFVILLLVLILVITYLMYKPRQSSVVESHLDQLNVLVNKSPIAFRNVAIGYNSCLDLIVNGLSVISGLGSPQPPNSGRLHDKISSSTHLLETFAHVFTHGSAAERFIENLTLCDIVTKASESVQDKQWSIGGNAALMGIKFARTGAQVLLGGAVGKHTKPLLPPNFKISKLGEEAKDEIHIIMEFHKGASWGSLQSPRANRLIVHCDYTNSRLGVVEEFHSSMKQFDADLVVIAGLHLLEGEKKEFRTQRLKTVVNQITASVIPYNVPLHFELASVADLEFMRELADTILPHVSSMGLNEQELGSLVVSIESPNDEKAKESSKKEFTDPSVHTVVNSLITVFNHVERQLKSNNKDNNKNRIPFGRIHFHSLRYHIVAIKNREEGGWEQGAASVAAGSLTASLQACEFPYGRLDPLEHFSILFDSWKELSEISRKTVDNSDGITIPFVNWTSQGITFYFAPVAVCKKPKKTVGLGDAISASGLMYHTYSHH